MPFETSYQYEQLISPEKFFNEPFTLFGNKYNMNEKIKKVNWEISKENKAINNNNIIQEELVLKNLIQI